MTTSDIHTAPYTGTDDVSIRAEQGRQIRLAEAQTKKNVKMAAGVGAIALIIGIVWTFWPSSAPVYEYGKNYAFKYSIESTSKVNDGRTVSTRLFVFENGTSYASPTESFGRPITIRDNAIKVNGFVIIRRHVPRLQIGAHTFDPGGDYDEVRYNMAHTEPQGVIPRITPDNKPPARGR